MVQIASRQDQTGYYAGGVAQPMTALGLKPFGDPNGACLAAADYGWNIPVFGGPPTPLNLSSFVAPFKVK